MSRWTAIGVGMLVIILLSFWKISADLRHMDDHKAVIWGTKKVASAITNFDTNHGGVLELGFVEGMIGQLFRDISLTVVYSLTSFFVAIVLIPCLSSLSSVKKKKRKSWDLILS